MGIFYKRPEKREFRYKPRYYEPDGGTQKPDGEYDLDKFADRIHRSWSSQRKSKNKTHMSGRLLLIVCIIVALLMYFLYRFF